jgi:hypothetical protein
MGAQPAFRERAGNLYPDEKKFYKASGGLFMPSIR